MPELANPTKVTIGGLDLTDYVTTVDFDWASILDGLPEGRIDVPTLRPFGEELVFQCRLRDMDSYVYRLLFNRSHPRLQAMRSAYRRKSKGWR